MTVNYLLYNEFHYNDLMTDLGLYVARLRYNDRLGFNEQKKRDCIKTDCFDTVPSHFLICYETAFSCGLLCKRSLFAALLSESCGEHPHELFLFAEVIAH